MTALIVIDMQNDFMPGGSLGVTGADQLIPLINRLIPLFPLRIATQDWHPIHHKSFAVNHTGKIPGDIITLEGLEQVLWPAHCVENTRGAQLAAGLDSSCFSMIFHKGTDPNIDSYSAFFDNAHRKDTGLADYLRKAHITDLYFAGVATDYCVLYSVLDACDLGFNASLILDACRAINLQPGDEVKSLASMIERGAKLVTSSQVAAVFQPPDIQARG